MIEQKTEQLPTHFKPKLGLLDATMIVAGCMVGSGIFIVSSYTVQDVGSTGWLIFVWVLTALMTVAAALSFVELSALFPRAGGTYIYLKEAYNPLIGFLYGWSFFTVIQAGMIAAVGVSFSKFAAYIFPSLSESNIIFHSSFINISAAQLFGIAQIILLTYINSLGIQTGKIIQDILTVIKLLMLFGLIVCGFALAFNKDIWNANWQHPFTIMRHSSSMPGYNGKQDFWMHVTGFSVFGAVAAAMVGAILTSDSWYNITFIAGEVKNPKRNVGLSLFLGTLIVTTLYCLCNVMYVAVLPLGHSPADAQSIAFAQDNRVGVVAALQIFGAKSALVVAFLIMLSNLGCNNGLVLSGARVYYAMAKDGLFFKSTGKLNKAAVPANGLWLQCLVASMLCLSGKYGDLLDYISFVVMLFYVITIGGVIVLRKKKPDLPRAYKAFGYPVVPIIYMILASVFCISLIIYRPDFTIRGLIIVLAGIPVYYFAIAGKKNKMPD
ncbi:MAG: amino acid permease [Parafilimonas sp.]|nr:amino acid permease [Parafilimonas sp.]